MADALREMMSFAESEGIVAEISAPGLLTVSNGPEQDARIRHDVEVANSLGLDDFHFLDGAECRELLHSERLRCGHWEKHSLLLDPAALARGLRDAALRRGVRVFEQTPVESLEVRDGGVEARTPFGTIFTIYAYITLTEPLSETQWSRLGWQRRMGVEDKRIMPHFHRPTPDGRILWGGRDAPFIATGPDPKYDHDPHIFHRLEETFRWTFPQLSDVRIEHAWAGPVCGTVRCISHIGCLETGRLFHALGYAGHGVGPTYLAGQIVRDLMLERETALLELPMATVKPVRLPPGPLRRLFLGSSQKLLLRADDNQGRGGPLTRLALRQLD